MRQSVIALLLVAGLSLPAGPARAGEALDLARKVQAVNRFEALRNVAYGDRRRPVVVIDRSAGGRILVNTFERWRTNDVDGDGVSARDLVIFRSGKLRGTGILMTEYADSKRSRDYVMWLPSLRKIRRVVEPDAADRWGNSNFSYGDIYLRAADDEVHEIVGRESFEGCLGAVELTGVQRPRHAQRIPAPDCSVQGREVYRLRSRPHRTDLGYDERITWVDVSRSVDYRSVYYLGGKAVKVIDKSWRDQQDGDAVVPFWVYWYAHSLDSGQEGMAYVDPATVSGNREYPDDFWSERTLRKTRR